MDVITIYNYNIALKWTTTLYTMPYPSMCKIKFPIALDAIWKLPEKKRFQLNIQLLVQEINEYEIQYTVMY